MKSARIAFSMMLLLAATTAMAQTPAQKSFDQLKLLAGMWEGKNTEGIAIKVQFRQTAGGSALMSETLGEGPENMVTMFHLDGPNRLMMTHYCGAGNQPRMAATVSADGKTFMFDFIDGTNLSGPADGHMQRLVITMLNANHHTEDWTFLDHGKEMKQFFDLERKM